MELEDGDPVGVAPRLTFSVPPVLSTRPSEALKYISPLTSSNWFTCLVRFDWSIRAAESKVLKTTLVPVAGLRADTATFCGPVTSALELKVPDIVLTVL